MRGKLRSRVGYCLFAVALWMHAIGCDRAQSLGEGGESPPSQATEDLVVDPKVLDFGEVLTDDFLIGDVRFENRSAGAARLIGIRSNCGCTAGTLEPNTLLPGESGHAKIILEATKPQLYSQSVLFHFDVSGHEVWKVVKVKVKARAPVEIVPRTVSIDFARGQQNAFVQKGYLTVRRSDIDIESISCLIKGARVHFGVERAHGNDARRIPWVLRLPSDMEGGPVTGKLVVSYLQGETRKKLVVPIGGAVRGTLRVSREALRLGVVKAKDNRKHAVWVESVNGQSFEITRVESNLPYLEIDAVLDRSDRRHRVEIGVSAHAAAEGATRLDGILHLETSLPGGERWRLPVKGFLINQNANSAEEMSQSKAE